MSDQPLVVHSWREARTRDIVIQVQPPGQNEPFVVALTSELERLAEYARRVRLLLTKRYAVDADTALQWLADARADDGRVVELLARLSDVNHGS